MQRLKAREDQLKAKVELYRANPVNFPREEIFGATDEHTVAMARRLTMEGQLTGLQGKRKLLDRTSLLVQAAQRQLLESTAPVVPADAMPLIDEAPRSGSRGTRVAFVHPKGFRGVLVELVQRP